MGLDMLECGLCPTRFSLQNRQRSTFAQLNARQQTIVLDAVKVQLHYELLWQSRNKKRLRPNPLAPWELRVGVLRVFYEVDAGEADLVNVLAIGIKRGNRLIVAGKEIRI